MSEALEKALVQNKDLVEVSPKSSPPVCKIMDFGEFLYTQKKAEKKNRKKQKKVEVKGIRIGFKTGEHDLNIKSKQATKFLESGNLVKIVMLFKGREISYLSEGIEKIQEFYNKLKDIGQVYQEPKQQGNQVIMILSKKK